MMKRILIISLLLLSVCPLLHSQEEASSISILNRVVPPSPEAAALARYGEYPVGHTTGVPKIEIPLYDIQLGDYHLPISISYHASGIRVDDVASTVGLGWVLNAGGVVTRTIHGAPDLRYRLMAESDTLCHSFERVDSLLYKAGVSGDGEFFEQLMDILTNGVKAEFDVESDRYCYNFAGKSGVFRYSHEKDDFVQLDYTPMYIYYFRGDSATFYILDTDGMVYVFSDQEYVGLAEDEGTTEISSWYLSEIQTPNGKIKFEYKNADDTYRIFTLSQGTVFGYFLKEEHSGLSLSRSEYFGSETKKSTEKYLYQTILLSSIQWNGNRIEFEYSNDRKDIPPNRLIKMIVKDIQGNEVKSVVFDNDSYMGINQDDYRMFLESVSISDEGKYTFNYDKTKRFPVYFRQVDGLPGNGQLHKSTTDYWGYWNGSSTADYVSAEVLQSAFTYYENQGCWVNGREEILKTAAQKHPVLEYAKTGILERITYPTGGSTCFEYESNTIGLDTIGGLRVKTINTSDSYGNRCRTNYLYTLGHLTAEPPKYLMQYKTYHVYYQLNGEPFMVERLATTSNPMVPLQDNSGSPMFYETIIECVEGIGYNRFKYIDSEYFNYRGLINTDYPLLSTPLLYDEGLSQPMLLEKEIYDADGSLLSTEVNEYKKCLLGTHEMGSKIYRNITLYRSDGLVKPLVKDYVEELTIPRAQVLAHSSVCLLKSRTVTDNVTGVSSVESFTYDSLYRNLKPKSVTRTGSDGKVYRTDYEYTIDRTDDLYDSMANDYGMLDQVVGERYYCNDNLLSTKAIDYVYNGETDWFYPKSIRSALQGNPLEEDIHFARYDNKGNILTLVENATDTVALVWGYHSQYPVAQIKGVSHERLRTAWGLESLLTSIESCDDSSEMGNHLVNLRTALANKNVLLTTYVYRPLFGPTAITNENGYTLYYDYHDDGKLSVIRDAQGIIKTFDYNYKHPHEE